MSEKLLSPQQFGERVGLRRTRVYELLAARVVPTIRLGGRIRVREGDVDLWIASGCPMAGEQPGPAESAGR